MNDKFTRQPLQVLSDEVAGPFLSVPLAQLPEVRARLDRDSIRYWVDSFAISLDGDPPVTVVSFGRKGDSARIQALLDEAG